MYKVIVSILAMTTIAFTSYAQDSDSATSTAPDSELKNYENWSVQCVRNQETDANACVLFIHLNLENGQRLLTFMVSENITSDETEQRAFVAVVTAPLGVYLPSGLQIQVDDAEAMALEFERCDQNGCYAGIALDEPLKLALIKGGDCKISFDNLERRTLTATLPLKGFTAGFNSL